MTTNRSNDPVCQSCGLPLEAQDLCGTDAAGLRVSEYCIFCFHNGRFTEPNISREQMIERIADLLMKEQRLAHMQARDAAEAIAAKLGRWDSGPAADASAHA